MRDILSTIISIADFFDDFNLYFRLKSVNFLTECVNLLTPPSYYFLGQFR